MAVFFVGFLIAKLVPPPSGNESAAQISAFLNHNTNGIRWGLIIAMFGAALFGPWIGIITKQIKRIEGPNSPSAYTQLALGSLLLLEFIFPLMVLEVAVFRPNRSPAEILLLSDLCWIPFLGLVFTFVVELVVTAITILQDPHEQPIFPRWVGVFSLVVVVATAPACLLMVYKTGPFGWNGALAWWIPLVAFGLWVFVMTAVMLQAVDRESVEEGPEPSGVTATTRVDLLAAEVAALREELHRAPSNGDQPAVAVSSPAQAST
jgi:hypothetical protein